MTQREEPALDVQPAPAVAGCKPYVIPPKADFIDLPLGNTERVLVSAEEAESLERILAGCSAKTVVGYPSAVDLEALLAERLGVELEQVLVTAGADEALERALEAVLIPGRELIAPAPTFEMIPIYAKLTGADVRSVPWLEGPYPADAVLAAITEKTAAVTIVTPNNPTGAVASLEDMCRIAETAPQVLVLVDMAYGEFADSDYTETLLRYPNVVMARTLSKAWGMPGLRVGYAVGDARVIAWMRGASGPYTVSRLSLAVAEARIREGDESLRVYVDRVRAERAKLTSLIAELGGRPLPSQANFILARFENAQWVRDGLAGLGIGSRVFPNKESLRDAFRISCPGDENAFARLDKAFRAVLKPQAILFDLDGVLADVSKSYRRSIIETAKSFGVDITLDDVSAVKAEGHANNDWDVTQRLLARRGVELTLEDVTKRFESIYQGTEATPGLRSTESLMVDRTWLASLKEHYPMAIVTGRPRADAHRFLTEQGILALFDAVVCMEDAELKPNPAPVVLALNQLKVETAWMLGDTPDDLVAARGAGVVPIGVVPPGEQPSRVMKTLTDAGAACVLERTEQLTERLP